MNIRELISKVGKRASVTAPTHPSITPLWLTGAPTAVSPETAQSVATVYSCVNVIAQSIAALPLKLYRRGADGIVKAPALDHALYIVLHDTPNPELTAFELREMMMTHVLLRGNAYCEIETNGRGDVIGLWPIHPDRVMVYRNNPDEAGNPWPGYRGLLYYIQVPNGKPVTLTSEKIWHLRGPSRDGIIGHSPLQVAHTATALAVKADRLAESVFDNGATPGGILKMDGTLSPEARDRLIASWEERHKGKAGRVALLEEGMAWETVSLTLQDMQFLESRKFQRSEILALFRVPPHMVGDLDKATFSNIEHQSLEFVVDTLQPWIVRFEQSITRDLIGKLERARVFAEFSVDGRLRGDQKSRFDAYHIARNDGWLSANDIRALENLNPIEGGDVYWQPLNMGAASASSRSWVRGYTTALRDAVGRVLRRELQDVGRRSSVDMTRFEKDHREFVTRAIEPVVNSALVFIGVPVDGASARISDYVTAFVESRLDAVRQSTIGEGWVDDNIDLVIDEEVRRFQAVFMTTVA